MVWFNLNIKNGKILKRILEFYVIPQEFYSHFCGMLPGWRNRGRGEIRVRRLKTNGKVIYLYTNIFVHVLSYYSQFNFKGQTLIEQISTTLLIPSLK